MSLTTTPAAPAIPAGFVLVPIEPTDDIVEALIDTAWIIDCSTRLVDNEVVTINKEFRNQRYIFDGWYAMLKAAPIGATSAAPVAPEGDKLDARSDDTKRLDYLQDRGSSIDLLPGDRGFYPMRFRIGGLSASVNVDVRIAIDAAMQATGATP